MLKIKMLKITKINFSIKIKSDMNWRHVTFQKFRFRIYLMSQVQRIHHHTHTHRTHSVERREHRNTRDEEKQKFNRSEDNVHRHNHGKHDDSDNTESELQKWRTTFDLLIQMIAKTADNEPKSPKNDDERRYMLVEMTGEMCRKAVFPTESKEYQDLREKYEHQKRKSQRLHKRAERMLAEVEENRNKLEDHLRKVQKGEKTETDKILKGIDQLMSEQAKNHRSFLEKTEYFSPTKAKPIKHKKRVSSESENSTLSADSSEYSN